MQAGADPDQRRSEPSPLIQSSRRGCTAAVDLLLAHHAGVNYRDARRRTALMWAAEGGHATVVDSLLAAGTEYKRRVGWTAIQTTSYPTTKHLHDKASAATKIL